MLPATQHSHAALACCPHSRLTAVLRLQVYTGARGPFWGRQYLFWHGGQPLTLIHEVFSPHLAQYLGGPSGSNGV